jgi:ParB family chromosome partitioning protein
MPFSEALTRMAAAAKKFDVGSISPAELALVAAVAGGEE